MIEYVFVVIYFMLILDFLGCHLTLMINVHLIVTMVLHDHCVPLGTLDLGMDSRLISLKERWVENHQQDTWERSHIPYKGHQKFHTEPYKAILGVGFPLHKPYPYSLHR